MKKFNPGQVVQVMGNGEFSGSLWIVQKEIENIVLVYSLGKNKVDTHFLSEDLEIIGESVLVTPSKYK